MSAASSQALTPTPFTIHISDTQLLLLQRKLDLVLFPDELEDAGWSQGAPRSDIQRLVDRWRTGYNWRAAETHLNETLPHFTIPIDIEGFGSLDIHHIHARSQRVNAIPLLFVHGWPGGFLEVAKILPLFIAPESAEDPAFHVVAPSLPGFGFSEAPQKSGFSMVQYAETCHKLMLALGYDEYVTQAGDWGSVITRKMATLYGPRHLKAWHTNMPLGTPPSLRRSPLRYLSEVFNPTSPKDRLMIQHNQVYMAREMGYMIQQSTRPQTLGYGLQDSPVGLLAWVYEKLVNWTDGYPWTDDEVLTWVSLYWFSRAGPTASLRIYYEVAQHGDIGPDLSPVDRPTVPHGVSYFPKECIRVPLSWVKASANVVYSEEHQKGGHFAAYENPEELVGDLRRMFGRKGPVFGVIHEKNGYGGASEKQDSS